MRKNLLVVLALALLLPSALVLAQTDPKIGYLQWPGEIQTRNLPAGTVTDPGSHLTYIIDTGVNARAIVYGLTQATTLKDYGMPVLAADSPLKSRLDADGNGQLDTGAIYQSFIAVTNVHPTAAVTVHFRYFNDNCEDVLDFLVVVTCNDTLLFDPFNFVIPFTGGENTRSRLIGPAGAILTPIPVTTWGSGRFVITGAASGASMSSAATAADADDDADILFPFEFSGLDNECNIEATGTLDPADSLADTVMGHYNGTPNVGDAGGLVWNNLHVFNASQISFNYLIGHLTTAVPKGFIKDAGVGDAFLAYGVIAWARPSVDRGADLALNPFTLLPDGDGPQVETGRILWGDETPHDSSNMPLATGTNFFYLRNEVHGGDISGTLDGSWYGALATTPFHPIAVKDNQLIHLLSVSDDYNGSNNAAVGFGTVLKDLSANISPAGTTYILQIYDSNEDMLSFKTPPVVPVSPPSISGSAVLKITCICLRVFMNFHNQASADPTSSEFNGSTSVDTLPRSPAFKGGDQTGALELDDLLYFGNEVFSGLGDFDGLLKPVQIDTKGSVDSSGGFIRFVRDNTTIVGVNVAGIGVPPDAGTSVSNKIARDAGTAVFNDPALADSGPLGPSYLTIGLFVLKFEGFGASWYLHAAASDPLVSSVGNENGTP